MDISLNKYISETGFCSRREADKYIEQCRVTINGVEAVKGNRVKEGDVVLVDGEPIKKKKDTVYLALNKPKGITCTTDLKDRTNIIDFVNFKTRIFPIGRLDKRSEGLIFLTNDGDIVNKILRAGNKHEKEYIVSVDKPITPEFIQRMRNGVRILGTDISDRVLRSAVEGIYPEDRLRDVSPERLRRHCLRGSDASAGLVQMGPAEDDLPFREEVEDDWVILVPAGTWHNVTNIGDEDLKVYALYGPPDHLPGTVHATQADAEADPHEH